MFLKNSRYLASERFAPYADGTLPFKGARPRPIGTATGVVEHGLQPGERLEALATHFYNDARLWWRIVDANADVLCAAEVEQLGLEPLPGEPREPASQDAAETEYGEVLLVPKAKE
ncbi:hypothetical protein [Variovorax saccharolyticus]|uniref:hypothetical protein n=1 Tax=Variovorax saccharolyticus TaxID=3053516 RepID=UPI002578206A|nr:hypothetical protein [Variovorax sp. J31P216]MDM0030045.1 hypothetical protein [Variovorax sp. J31P216]